MTNTFLLAGESDPEEIIRSVPTRPLLRHFGGGQVDITSGNFVFSASESYLIEDGGITRPVRDATLIGNGPEALQHVSMVGNDLELDEGVGMCGKEGQSVPVGVGMPTVKNRPHDRGRDRRMSRRSETLPADRGRRARRLAGARRDRRRVHHRRKATSSPPPCAWARSRA